MKNKKRRIRTPGTLRYNGFRDRHIRPLCHLSYGRSREEETRSILRNRCKDTHSSRFAKTNSRSSADVTQEGLKPSTFRTGI